MSFNVGDVVDFTDPSQGSIHRGVIINHVPGKDVRSADIGRPAREYVIKFDKPWYNYDSAWVSAEDLTIVRKSKSNPTVMFTTSTTTSSSLDEKYNIKVTASNNPLEDLLESTISKGNTYPWSPYYITSDDFFAIMKVAFEDTYGSDHEWHPEDLYYNVSCVLEIVSNTLANMVRIKSGRELSGVSLR